MIHRSRRAFLGQVGRGMLISSLGPALAYDMGLAHGGETDGPERLTFGSLEPLVCLMQDTPLDQIQPVALQEIHRGTTYRQLMAAAALANARTFGGQDYIGYHTLMAMAPALQMATELSEDRSALPVLKLLHRNTQQIHAAGGSGAERLHLLTPSDAAHGDIAAMFAAIQAVDYEGAERAFLTMPARTPGQLFQSVIPTLHEAPDVHRVVLAWRSFAMADLAGTQNAQTLLRQSIRYAVSTEEHRRSRSLPEPELRSLLPRLVDQFGLSGAAPGDRDGDDAWLDELSQTILVSTPAGAAEAVAEAIRGGYAAEVIGEAISVAANLLLLQDPGRKDYTTDLKPAGSVHGDSVGVHASDAANAWRNIVRVSSRPNQVASLIVAAWHTAGQRARVGDAIWPTDEHQQLVRSDTPERLLQELDDAVRSGDQAHACAVVQRYSTVSSEAGPVFARLIQYATSEDGALHAEKFYATVREEFRTVRSSRRWRHVIGLARVTASEYGRRAEGYEQAIDLLGLRADSVTQSQTR